VTVGLNAPEDGVALSIQRKPAGPDGATYQLDYYLGDNAQGGTTTLLRGTPAPPTKAATSTHGDMSVTEATWASGWDAVNVGLGDQAIKQPPTDNGGPLIEVTHKTTNLVLVDAAHPKGLTVGIAALHARAGDRVTLQARTATTGTHTAIAITDQRTGSRVASPG
jgi:hypothetical protein